MFFLKRISSDEKSRSVFLPFWKTPPYGGGLLQGLGIGFFICFVSNKWLNATHANVLFFLAGLGVVLIVLGGIIARRKFRNQLS